jgi:uncharacterized repeat protein (TIGR02543 family)
MKTTQHFLCLRLSMTASLGLWAATGALAQFSGGGSGTAQSPYIIKTDEDLNTVRSFVGTAHSDKHFRMGGDVDLTTYLSGKSDGWNPIGNSTTTTFAGNFHGGGYKVTGLTINRTSMDYVGLFGYSTGSIDSLGVEGTSITGKTDVGGLIGCNAGTVSSCHATVNVTGANAGGLIGYNTDTVSSCYATGNVTGTDNAGGLIGYSYIGAVSSSCYATGNVTAIYRSGGLIGYNVNSTVSKCYATGNASSTYASSSTTSSGGLIGYSISGAVSNCYATGSASVSSSSSSYSSYRNVGGLIGYFTGAADKTVTCCYSTGLPAGTATNKGASIGYCNDASYISACYYNVDVTDALPAVGNTTTSNVTGLTTGAMKYKALYVGWDFDDVWAIREGLTYPFLRDNIPVDKVCAGSTTTYEVDEGKADYVWAVTGGSILLGQSTNQIVVEWGSGESGRVSVTHSGGALARDVTISALPAQPSISGSMKAPAGSTATYATAEGMSSYTWTVTGGSITSGQGTSAVQVAWGCTPGEDSVKVNYANAAGCAAALPTDSVVTVTVNPAPRITGSKRPTGGATVSYSTDAGMSSYAWAATGGTITSGQSSATCSVKWSCAATDGQISVSYDNPNACVGAASTDSAVAVQDAAGPVIAGDMNPPSGSTRSYATTPGMSAYEWTVTNGTILSGSGTYSVSVRWSSDLTAGSIGVGYTNSNGCPATQPTDSTVTIRELSSDATLNGISAMVPGGDGVPGSNLTLTPAFHPDTTRYTLSVDNSLTSFSLSAVRHHTGASVSGEGTKSLSVGANTFSIVVTAEDNVTTKTYTVVITRERSSNARLRSITVNPSEQISLSPTFHPDTLSYTASVANSVSSISLTATAQHAEARVTGAGDKTLSEGVNTFSIVVRAEDSVTTKTYTVTVTRAESLPVSNILSENFEESISGWTVVNGGYTNKWFWGTATAASGSKSMYISNDNGTSNAYTFNSTSVVHFYRDVYFPPATGGYRLNFQWKGGGEVNYDYLAVYLVEATVTPSAGSTLSGTALGTYYGRSAWPQASITLPAASYSGTTKRLVFSWMNNNNNYGGNPPAAVDNIVVSAEGVAPQSDASLSSLTLSGGVALSPSFHANTTSYTASVANEVSSVTLTAAAKHAGAIVSGAGAKTLSVGPNTFYVVGTAQDGVSTKTYTVVVTRAGSSDAALSSLTLSNGIQLTPAFHTDTTAYAVSVPDTISSVTITAAAHHDSARVTGTGDKTLNEGINTFSIVVRAEDGVTTKTYTVRITRAEVLQLLSEDFEGGTAGWTIVNGSQTNKWVCGTATAASGSKSMYISNDNGTSNAYTLTSTSVVHFYRDVYFTPSTGSYQLSFQWKGMGQVSYDGMIVYLVEATVTPSANYALSGLELRSFKGYSAWQQASITLPAASYSGTTKRLIFSWWNDNSLGAQPPAAVDNILISKAVTPQSDASLSSLTLSSGVTLSPTFQATTLSYTASVANEVSSVTLTATPYITGASVAGDGAKSLSVGPNTFSIVVTAANGVTTRTYTVTVTRAPVTRTVTFNSDGGSAVEPQNVEVDSAAVRPANPTRAGHTFVNWYNGSEVWNFATPITANITLTAHWTAETYAVAFNLNGGSGVAPLPQSPSYGARVSKPADPSRAGHTFIGWWSGETEYDFNAPVAGSLYLTAKWIAATYTITFNAGGGTVSPPSKLVVYNEVVGTLPTPVRSGYDFTGWNAAQSGSGTRYDAKTVYAATDNITLYAQWVEGSATAVEATPVATLKVYPNPTTGVVTVENDGAEVHLYTLTGTLLLQTQESRIDLSPYASGVYLLTVGGKTAKIILISD